MQGNGYTIGFAAAICVVCSLLLSGVSGALKPRQEENRVLDRQKNILVALGYAQDDVAKMERSAVTSLYNENVVEMVVDGNGQVMEGKKPSELPAKIASGEEYNPSEGLAVYMRKGEGGGAMAYAYPITGKGLWSTLLGYLAVKPDGNEIVGITFYKHGETPGLGAEIEQPWFRNNFVGKKLYDESGSVVGVNVVKGLAKDNKDFATKAEHMVDGMSGATLTGNGVTKLMSDMPKRYTKFFANVGGAQ